MDSSHKINAINRLGSDASFNRWIQDTTPNEKCCDDVPPSERSTRESLPEDDVAVREGMWLPAETMLLMNQIQLMNDLRQLGHCYPAVANDSKTGTRDDSPSSHEASAISDSADPPDLIQLESLDIDISTQLKEEVCARDLIRLDSDALPGLKTPEQKEVHLLDTFSDGQGSFPFQEHSCSLIDTITSDFQSITSSLPALTVESACLESSVDMSLSEDWCHEDSTPRDKGDVEPATGCEAPSGDFCACVLSDPPEPAQHTGASTLRPAGMAEEVGDGLVKGVTTAPPTEATAVDSVNSADDLVPSLPADATRAGDTALDNGDVGAAVVGQVSVGHPIQERPSGAPHGLSEGSGAVPPAVAGHAAGRAAQQLGKAPRAPVPGKAAAPGSGITCCAPSLETEDVAEGTPETPRERFIRVVRQALVAAQNAVKCGQVYVSRSLEALEPTALSRSFNRLRRPTEQGYRLAPRSD